MAATTLATFITLLLAALPFVQRLASSHREWTGIVTACVSGSLLVFIVLAQAKFSNALHDVADARAEHRSAVTGFIGADAQVEIDRLIQPNRPLDIAASIQERGRALTRQRKAEYDLSDREAERNSAIATLLGLMALAVINILVFFTTTYAVQKNGDHD